MGAELTVKLIEIALNKGVDEAEAYVRESKNLSIEVKKQQIDTIESSVTAGYCIRVVKDSRIGFSYSTNPDEIKAVAEKAIEASKYSEPDSHIGLPLKAEPLNMTSVEVFDNNITLLSENDAIDQVFLIESSALREDKSIKKIRRASGSFTISNTYIMNSRGINLHYPSTVCSASIMAIAEEGNDSQIGWDYEGSRFLRNISFEQVGRNAAKRAVQLLKSRKITPIKGFVLLDNLVSSGFLGILSSSLSAESVQKKKSIFVGKMGELVFNQRFNIIDSGLLDEKPGSKPVDDEGVPTTSKTLIEGGILSGFLHNTYTAKVNGEMSTGNAVRGGFRGLPSVGPTNFYIEPVSKEHTGNIEKTIKMVDKGLYVTETMGMHTANPITGEFSVGASGLWIENGEIKYPVKEAVISGNILHLFKNVVIIGDDLKFYGNIGSPFILIEGIDISG